MTKYICTMNEETHDWDVELDDPNYDGPVTNVEDPEGVYHVEANSVEEAKEIADYELEIDRWL